MRSFGSYLPATFEERGISVAFTTPQLCFCRVRKDYRSRLEIVVPNIAEAKGNYIIPWAALANAVTLTAHDRALTLEVEHIEAISPDDIRTAQLIVARDGLAGEDVADAAAASLARDEEHVVLTNLMLMAKVIMAANSMSAQLLAGIAKGESDDLVRDAAYKAAATIGMKPSQLDEKMGTLSRKLAPLGVEGAPEPGRLRKLIQDLQEFHDSLLQWANDNVRSDVELARFCAEVAALTLDRGRGLVQDFDKTISQPLKVLRFWMEESPKIENSLVRLSWLLDGWNQIIGTWRTARAETKDAQVAALSVIFRALPLLPRSEFEDMERKHKSTLRISRKSSVRMYENWQTGELDYDLIARIEAAKASMI